MAILLRIEHRYHFRKWTADTAVQLAIVREEAGQEAKGFYLKLYNPDDLASPILQEETGFMHGYSYLLSVLPFRGKSLLTVSFFLDILSIGVLSVCVCLLLYQLGGSEKTMWYFLIFWGLAPPLLHYLPAVDLFSLTFFFLGCFTLLRNWDKGGRTYAYMLFFFGLAASMRNAFLPFVILPALLAGWNMWVEQKFSMRHANAFLLMPMMMIALLSMNKVGGYHFSVMDEKLYFSHWLHMDPFPFKSIFYFGIPHEIILATYATVLPKLLKAFSVLISLGLIWAITQPLWAKWHKAKIKQREIPLWHLSLLCWAVMTINVSMLLFFSLSSPPENWSVNGFWTFVMETRYFVPTMLLMLILFFIQAFKAEHWKGQKLLRILIITAVIINSLFSFWLKFEIYVLGQKEDTFVHGPIPSLLDELEKETAKFEGEILISSEQNIRAGEIMNTVFLPIDWLSEQERLHTNEEVQIWLIVPDNHSDREKYLLEKWPFIKKTRLGESALILYGMRVLP